MKTLLIASAGRARELQVMGLKFDRHVSPSGDTRTLRGLRFDHIILDDGIELDNYPELAWTIASITATTGHRAIFSRLRINLRSL